ncbi:YDG domain-containing protein [Eubacterium sp.]|uniref:YDG domain-containing protein n=1 Tax=Eubacterium sp. TaxID=142586 RepID=UPI0039A2DA55
MKKTKRIISILLSVLMILTGMPTMEQKVFADDSQLVTVTEENYASYGLTKDYVGYYAIETKEQLLEFAQKLDYINRRSNAVLIADIDYSGVGRDGMIGSGNLAYGGTFDGNGHTVTLGFDVTSAYAALFTRTADATIKNLKTEGTIKTTGQFAAGIVGSADRDTKIDNCVSSVSFSSTISGDGTFGGIVALAYSGTEINNCAFLGSFKDAPNTNSNGGIVGWTNDLGVNISNCYVYGEIGTNTENCAIISRGTNKPNVKNCYYTDDYGMVNDGCSKMSKEQFAEGEVCYKLNQNSSENCVWFQKIGEDKAPVLNNTVDNIVYGVPDCANKLLYSNTQNIEKHKYEFVKNDDDSHSLKCIRCGDVKETHALTLIKKDEGNCETKTVYHYHCDTCDKDVDIEGDYVHQYKLIKKVKATCTKDGYTLYVCEKCNEEKKESVVKSKGHNYEEVERKEADCLKDGYVKSKCTVCNSKKTETLKSKGHNFVDGVCTVCGAQSTGIRVTTYTTNEETGEEESIQKYYDDFEDAVSAALGTKSTITLQSDVQIESKNENAICLDDENSLITIDFGKYNFTVDYTELSFEEGQYVLKGTSGTVDAAMEIYEADVTIDSGNYQCNWAYQAITVGEDGSLTVNGGKITGNHLAIYSMGRTIITGGEFHGESCALEISPFNHSEIYISGGMFKTDKKDGAVSIDAGGRTIFETGYVAYLLDDNGNKTDKIMSGEYGTDITENGDIIVDRHEKHTYGIWGACENCGQYIEGVTEDTVAIVTIGDEITAWDSLNEAFNKAEGKKATIAIMEDVNLESPINIDNSNTDITVLLNECTIDGEAEDGTINYINVNAGKMAISDVGMFNNVAYNNGQTLAEQLEIGYVYYDNNGNIIDVWDNDAKATDGEMYYLEEHYIHDFDKENGICSTCKMDAEAKVTIGNTESYMSDIGEIFNMINASSEDVKITFLKDIETSSGLSIRNSENIDITLDFGEHILKCNDLSIFDKSSVVFTGTTGGISSRYNTIYVDDNSNLLIDGGEYSSVCSSILYVSGQAAEDNVVIKSGKFSAKRDGNISASGSISKILADGTVIYDSEGKIVADHNYSKEFLRIKNSYVEAREHTEHRWVSGRCAICNLADSRSMEASAVVTVGDDYKYFDKLEDAFTEASGKKAEIALLKDVIVEKEIIIDDVNSDITLNFNGFKTDGNITDAESGNTTTNYIWFKAGKLSIKGKAEFNNIRINNGQIFGDLIDEGYVYYDEDGNLIGTHKCQNSFTNGNIYIVDLHVNHTFNEKGEPCSECMAKPTIKITEEGVGSHYLSDIEEALAEMGYGYDKNITLTLLDDMKTDEYLSISGQNNVTIDFSKYTLSCRGLDVRAKKVNLNATTGGVKSLYQTLQIWKTEEGVFINGGTYISEFSSVVICSSDAIAKISSGTFISNEDAAVISCIQGVGSIINQGNVWTDEEGNVLEGAASKKNIIHPKAGKAIKVSEHKEHSYENHYCRDCLVMEKESANVSVQIGETENCFETLLQAIEYANGKDAYITLLKDYEDINEDNLGKIFSIDKGNITIDLGNYNYTLNYVIKINGGNVQFKGEKGSLRCNEWCPTIWVNGGAGVSFEGGNYYGKYTPLLVQNTGNVSCEIKLKNAVFEGKIMATYFTFDSLSDSEKIYIDGCKMVSDNCALQAIKANVTIRDVEISSSTIGAYFFDSTVKVYSGTFEAEEKALYLQNTSAEILGGYYNGSTEINFKDKNKLQFLGGTFRSIRVYDEELSHFLSEGYVFEDSEGTVYKIDSPVTYLEKVTVKKHLDHINEQGKCKYCNTLMDTTPVVSVTTDDGTQCYDSVSEAVEAVNTDATINVYADCSEDEKILLNAGDANVKFNIKENVTLTANKGIEVESGNVVFDVKGTMETDDSLKYSIIAGKDAILTLNSGTYRGVKIIDGLLADILQEGKVLVDENDNIVAHFGLENVSETDLTVSVKEHTNHNFTEGEKCSICNVARTVIVTENPDNTTVNETYFANFTEAWDYADGKKAIITLLSDQNYDERLNGSSDSDITVNLGKYTINFKGDNENYPFVLSGGKYEFNATTGGINSEKNLIFCDDGTTQLKINGGRYCGLYGIQINSLGTTNIYNAYIETKSTNSGAISVASNSENFDITVKNTELVSKGFGIYSYSSNSKGQTNIAVQNCNIMANYAAVYSSNNNSEITIDGGEYTSEGYGWGCIEAHNGKINVVDGNFTGLTNGLNYVGGEVKLSGGTFKNTDKDGYSIYAGTDNMGLRKILADEYLYEGIDGEIIDIDETTANWKEPLTVVKCQHNFDISDNGDGTHTYKCDTCNFEKIENCKYTKTTIPPCEGEGYDLYECEICKAGYDDNYIPQKGHDIEYISNENGTHTKHCKVCDKSIETIDCSYGDYQQNSDGKTHTGKCEMCGYVNKNLSHNYVDYTSLNNGKHSSICTDCGYEHIEDCDYTYEQDQANLNMHNMTCKKCGYKKSRTHDWKITAKDNVLIFGCEKCDYEATATLVIDKSVDLTYSGKAIEPVTVVYSENWVDNKDLLISYVNNIKAGEATASVTVYNVTAEIKFHIAKKQLTVNVTVENKEYDGTTDAVIKEAEIQGIVDGDNVGLVNGTAAFADKHVGKDKSVNFTEFTITGDDADNYTLVQPTGIVAEITAKSIEDLTTEVEKFSEETVKSSDKTAIENIKESIGETKTATDNEEELGKLKELEGVCDKLLGKIETVNKELTRLTEAVNSYDKNTVSDKDKADVEKLVSDIDTLLKTNNLTDEERESLSTVKVNAEEILKNCVKRDDNTGNNGTVNPDNPTATIDSVLRVSKITFKGSKLKVKWNNVAGAEGYDVFIAANGKKAFSKKPAKVVKGKSCSIKKLGKKKLSAKASYKVRIKAFKFVNGKKTYITSSDVMSIAGSKNKKYTNAKKIKIKKSKATLTKGKTFKISASAVKQNKKKKLLNGKKKFYYYSGNTSVATVNNKGIITAVAQGRVTIYVVAQNGVKKAVTLTVK